ncbi:ubiquinol-cytochrome c reductase iron-sulfur subunit [Aquibacillus sp. 3ASR75-11]|uniref:Menaquinol:cytochrome c reductase iron-sulfur subunit n=1 Tax=Terrihalobacillus insolitus TaxID=2950438 RepID=A0A9X3WTY0_9BACI|nr:ubiquinol-cytochrome c reductase iron-sulfur subunit [Terrihalobacillus insolitus]MDC3413041.1 ubiquinol-cytochrome c reductase iron-sulfur subunit [Terrihalobacillus insolitus]MDC3424783.1 ubiquinol-cytochrome c reductase iron-sulfur subunit [Terrihalobacillus insolitus]
MSEKKQQVSRRQFLNYTLTGVGGFMAAGMLTPMIRMAVDPVLQPKKSGDLVAVVEVDKLTTEPQRFDWEIDQVDAWYESKVTKTAWVFIQEDDSILALSPICTHLGCTVSWEGNEEYPNQYYCPCHGGRYYKNGVNVPGLPPPAPLAVYDQDVKDGTLYLGKAISRKGA